MASEAADTLPAGKKKLSRAQKRKQQKRAQKKRAHAQAFGMAEETAQGSTSAAGKDVHSVGLSGRVSQAFEAGRWDDARQQPPL
jgi:hypothetical protein